MRRWMPAALAAIFFIVPLFPSFIALTGVNFPGFSLVPRPLSIAIFALCGLLALYAIAMLIRYPARNVQPLLLPLLAIFFAGLLAGIVGFDPVAGILFTCIGGFGIVWHASILRFYADRNAALAIFWAMLISGTLASALAVAMVVARSPAAQFALQHGRATGTFVLPGELAGYLIVLLPPAFVLGCVGQRALRPIAWVTFAVGLAALFLTYSRAGWMGFAAACAFLVATRIRHGLGAAAAVVAAGTLAVLLLFNAHHDPSEDYTRISIWQTATQIVDRFPLTGVGPFNFSRLYALLRAPDGDPTAFHAHSLYLTFFAEFGIVGLVAAGWAFWRFAVELRRRLIGAPPARAFLALAIAAGLVGVAVQGLIDTVSVVIFGLWFPTLGLALAVAGGGDPEPADG